MALAPSTRLIQLGAGQAASPAMFIEIRALDLETRRLRVHVTIPVDNSSGPAYYLLFNTLAVNCTAKACMSDYSTFLDSRVILIGGTNPVDAAVDLSQAHNPTEPVVMDLDLPVDGDPAQYPGDTYIFSVGFDLGARNIPGMPQNSPTSPMMVNSDYSLANYIITMPDNLNLNGSPVLRLIMRRPASQQVAVYAVLGVPLIVGWMLVHLSWLRRMGPQGSSGLIVGLSAVLLTILPLRTVLVPSQVPAMTRIDYCLGYEMLVLVAAGAAAYVVGVVNAPKAGGA